MGALVIDNIAIPFTEYNDRWIAPDLDETWRYYPNYLRHAVINHIKPLSPVTYLMRATTKLPTGEIREKALRDYMSWAGVEYLQQLQLWHEMYKEQS